MVGKLANSSLPSIEVVPPSNGFNVTWSVLLMTLDVNVPGLIPFVQDKQHLLTGLIIQAGSSSVKLMRLAVQISHYISLASPAGLVFVRILDVSVQLHFLLLLLCAVVCTGHHCTLSVR